jgi:hypothetical protein
MILVLPETVQISEKLPKHCAMLWLLWRKAEQILSIFNAEHLQSLPHLWLHRLTHLGTHLFLVLILYRPVDIFSRSLAVFHIRVLQIQTLALLTVRLSSILSNIWMVEKTIDEVCCILVPSGFLFVFVAIPLFACFAAIHFITEWKVFIELGGGWFVRLCGMRSSRWPWSTSSCFLWVGWNWGGLNSLVIRVDWQVISRIHSWNTSWGGHPLLDTTCRSGSTLKSDAY